MKKEITEEIILKAVAHGGYVVSRLVNLGKVYPAPHKFARVGDLIEDSGLDFILTNRHSWQQVTVEGI